MKRRFKRVATIVSTLLGFLAPANRAWALDPAKALTQYTRTEWNQADGLPQNTIGVIAQTKDGYLWMGTNEGLVRFDGYDFTDRKSTRLNSSHRH